MRKLMDGWMDGKSIQPPSQMVPAPALSTGDGNQHPILETTTGGKLCRGEGG